MTKLSLTLALVLAGLVSQAQATTLWQVFAPVTRPVYHSSGAPIASDTAHRWYQNNDRLSPKTLSEAGDKVADAEKEAITAAIEDLKAAFTSENLDEIRGKSEALAQASMKLGEAMYAAGQAEAEAGADAAAGDGETSAATEDDKVAHHSMKPDVYLT